MGKAAFSTLAVMVRVIGVVGLLIHNTRLKMICFAPFPDAAILKCDKIIVVVRVPRSPGKRTGQSENLSPPNPVDRTIHFIYLGGSRTLELHGEEALNQLSQENPASDNTAVTGAQSATTERKFPVGLILIIIYVGFGMVSALVALGHPVIIVAGVALTGLPVVLASFTAVAIHIALLVGLIRRKEWARVLGIVWFTYSLCINVVNSAVIIFNRQEVVSAYGQATSGFGQSLPADVMVLVIYVVTLLICAINAAVIIYLVDRKRYFGR